MITVYYGCYNYHRNSSLFCNEPEPVIKNIISGTELVKESEVFKCPALQDYLYNLYQITSTWDISFEWTGESIITKDLEQNLFNEIFTIRNVKKGFLSYHEPFIHFFADCDELKMSLQPVVFEKNGLDILTIPGVYDIANHFRKLELPMIIKKPQVINITQGMPLYYIRFHTDKKIKFVRFNITSELHKLADGVASTRSFTKKIIPLDWYYKTVKKFYKKRFLKIIKENILE